MPRSSGVFCFPTFYCKKSLHSYVRIRYIDEVLLLIIANFMSWALEKHLEPEIQHVNMQLV